MAQPYFIVDHEIGFDEDDMHEFKSHRSICVESTPNWCILQENGKIKRSRQPVSKTICGFLNTAKGGTCYLGVLNEGIVKGLRFTQYQRDHLILDIHDLLGRFEPKVPPEQVKIDFKPVFDAKPSQDQLNKVLSNMNSDRDKTRFERDHILRSSSYCWCDKDATAKYNQGLITTCCVVEITILPWNGENRLNCKTPLYPLYQNEEGLCYVRRQASNAMLTLQDVYDMTKNQVMKFHAERLCKLEAELMKLKGDVKRKVESRQQNSSGAFDT